MDIKNYRGKNRDDKWVILKQERHGAHWIFNNMNGWFGFDGRSGIHPDWSGDKPYFPDKCFYFYTKEDAEKALKVVIKNLRYPEHKKIIEVIQFKDVKTYNIIDILNNNPEYAK